ncbi:MAG: TIGR01777 family oxidoreductase [Bacteroidetes bacterium]|nr:TIGR01777 family oxidoreductase [Bacteroidota bacterium]
MAHKILITGASGLIGQKLTDELIKLRHSVVHFSRTLQQGKVKTFVWNIFSGEVDPTALEGVDTIIHLAGAGIADKRWTPSRKKEILESRTRSTQLLFETLKNNSNQVRSFISASAIGYYGFNEEKIFVETDGPGNDFLACVTQRWEAEADKINELGIRVVKIRIGIVLSKRGGALAKMAKPINYFVGSPLGTGKQMMSWIHLDDLCSIFSKAVDDAKIYGAYNAIAGWNTNAEVINALAKILNKPIWLPNVPAFALKMILGKMSEMVLNGSRVSSEKIKNTGFHFKFSKLEEALADLFN